MCSRSALFLVSCIWLKFKIILRWHVALKPILHKKFQVHLISPNIGDLSDIALDIEQQCSCFVSHFKAPEETLTSNRPDLIILDMADKQSVEYIECLTTCFQSPIIVLSDRPSMAIAVNVMRAGGCDFFPKPVSKSALVERLKTLLVKTPSTNLQALSASSVPSTHMVTPFAEQERQIIEDALGVFQGNITQAAEALQISPSTIYRKKQGWDHAQSN